MRGREALAELVEGNRRFVAGRRVGVNRPPDFAAMTESQNPFAAVLCCSDSRVPPEHVFDRAFGEIFVTRVAGNVAGPAVLGSLEYAVVHLRVPLLLVLGHEGCGAIKEALKGPAWGAVGDLLNLIGPALEPLVGISQEGEGALDEESLHLEAVKANVWHTMAYLVTRSRVLLRATRRGALLLAGALYYMRTGEVHILAMDDSLDLEHEDGHRFGTGE